MTLQKSYVADTAVVAVVVAVSAPPAAPCAEQ